MTPVQVQWFNSGGVEIQWRNSGVIMEEHRLARMDTALKRHGWAARWVKAIFAKGYTQSIDTAR